MTLEQIIERLKRYKNNQIVKETGISQVTLKRIVDTGKCTQSTKYALTKYFEEVERK